MSAQQQRLNAFTGRAERRQLLGQIETRQVQGAGEIAVGIRQPHDAMVADEAPSTEVQTAPEAGSNGVQSLDLDAVIEGALRASGLTHGQLCAYMADEHGKPLDQSLWTRMRRDGNLPIRKMRRATEFWRHFVIGLGEQTQGVQLSHPDAEAAAIGDLLQAAGRLMGRFQVRAQLPASGFFDRRRA